MCVCVGTPPEVGNSLASPQDGSSVLHRLTFQWLNLRLWDNLYIHMSRYGLVYMAEVSRIKKKRSQVFRCTQTQLQVRFLPLVLCFHSFLPPSTPPRIQAVKHQTPNWINYLIIPYNISATPNLAHAHLRACADRHLCGLSLMLPQGCSWQMTAPLVCQPWVSSSAGCVCVCTGEEEIIEGDGGEHWQDSFSLIGWSKHPADLWIFDRKDSLLWLCCSANYEKRVIFFLSERKPSCAGKTCYLAIYRFFPGV